MNAITGNMNKHAYLIMAHGNWNILNKLLMLLDDPRHDIYLHVDAKVEMPAMAMPQMRFSNVTMVPPISVYWADFTQVEATFVLLRAAQESGKYSYYHLLSGTDMPLRTNDEIYSFFEDSGKEFVGIVPKEVYYSVRRVKFYHPFLHNRYYRKSKILKAADRLLEYGQRIVGVNRLRKCDWKIIDGWTWFSITDKLCSYVLENEKLIRKRFSHSIASDELFLQTLVYNSHFFSDLYDVTDLKNGSMRYIDWTRGRPYTWGGDAADLKMLLDSPYMFARKFDERHFDIVQSLMDELRRRSIDDERAVGMEDQKARH